MRSMKRSFAEIKTAPSFFFMFMAVDLVIIFFFFVFTKRSSGYPASLFCLCDYVEHLCSSNLFRTVFIPTAIVCIYLMSESPQTSNAIIRFNSKTQLTTIQFIKAFLLSLCFSFFTILSSIGLGFLFTKTIYNWDSQHSLFFLSHQYCIFVSFPTVLLWATYRVFIWLILFSSILIVLWRIIRRSYCFMVLFALIICNLFDMVSYYASLIIGQNTTSPLYISLSDRATYFIVFPFVILILIILSFKLAKKKEYMIP